MIVATLHWLYLIAWLVLLVHLIRRRDVYPLVGGRGWSKAIWLISFLLLNPFLTAVYAVLSIGRKTSIEEPPKLRVPRAAAWAMVVAGLVLYEFVPWVGPLQPSVATRDAAGNVTGVGTPVPAFRANIDRAERNSSYFVGSSGSDTDFFQLRSVWILPVESTPLVTQIARDLQRLIIEELPADRVEIRRLGQPTGPDDDLPDAIVWIEEETHSGISLPFGRRGSSRISYRVTNHHGPESNFGFPEMRQPMKPFFMGGSIEGVSTSVGTQSPAAHLEGEGRGIAGEIFKGLKKSVDEWSRTIQPLPHFPEGFHGEYQPASIEPSMERRNAVTVYSASPLFWNNVSMWQFDDPRPDSEVLVELRDELIAQGWKVELDSEGRSELWMKRGDESLAVQRRQETTGWGMTTTEKAHPAPFVVNYVAELTKGQLNEAYETVLRDPESHRDILFALWDWRVINKTDSAGVAFYEMMKSLEPRDVGEALRLARSYKHDKPYARAMLLKARVLNMMDLGRPMLRANEITKLAKELGEEELATVPLTPEDLHSAGFVNVADIEAYPAVFVRDLDQPLALVSFREPLNSDFFSFEVAVIRVNRRNAAPPATPYWELAVYKGSARKSSRAGDRWSGESFGTDGGSFTSAPADENWRAQTHVGGSSQGANLGPRRIEARRTGESTIEYTLSNLLPRQNPPLQNPPVGAE